jgi:hypothetical protein
VTTPAFLGLWGLTSLRDLPDLDRLEEAGLLGKAPLPEELRGALGIRDDDEDGAEERTWRPTHPPIARPPNPFAVGRFVQAHGRRDCPNRAGSILFPPRIFPPGEARADEGDGPHPGGLLSGSGGRVFNLAGRLPRPACGCGAVGQGLRSAFPADPAPVPPRKTTAMTVSGFVSGLKPSEGSKVSTRNRTAGLVATLSSGSRRNLLASAKASTVSSVNTL